LSTEVARESWLIYEAQHFTVDATHRHFWCTKWSQRWNGNGAKQVRRFELGVTPGQWARQTDISYKESSIELHRLPQRFILLVYIFHRRSRFSIESVLRHSRRKFENGKSFEARTHSITGWAHKSLGFFVLLGLQCPYTCVVGRP
jgi:hypothetical protein